MTIPVVLVAYARNRRNLPFRHLFWLFGLFIIGCGFTHFMSVVTYYHPVYRLDGLVKVITALASWGTVAAIFQVAPKALAMRMPEDLEREIIARKEVEADLKAARAELERRVEERTRELYETNRILQAEVDERRRAEEMIRRNQADIEALNHRLRRAMQETHHRVKNNLQIICALVDLQSSNGSDTVPVSELKRLGQHTRTLSALHDLLTREARKDDRLEDISVRAILDTLLPVIRSLAAPRSICLEVADARLPLREGTSLAILINELVSNSIKHGQGEIKIAFQVDEVQARLDVSDQGPGFPVEFDPQAAAQTGLYLVENLSRLDLRGAAHYGRSPEGGACVSITFPLVPVLKAA